MLVKRAPGSCPSVCVGVTRMCLSGPFPARYDLFVFKAEKKACRFACSSRKPPPTPQDGMAPKYTVSIKVNQLLRISSRCTWWSKTLFIWTGHSVLTLSLMSHCIPVNIWKFPWGRKCATTSQRHFTHCARTLQVAWQFKYRKFQLLVVCYK